MYQLNWYLEASDQVSILGNDKNQSKIGKTKTMVQNVYLSVEQKSWFSFCRSILFLKILKFVFSNFQYVLHC